jgi:integrase/recombinase XerC
MPPTSSTDSASREPLIEGFRAHLRAERRLSAQTVKNYLRDIDALLRLAQHRMLAELSPHDIRRFVATLHGQGLSGRTLARMLSGWRSFFEYLARDHGYNHNPCAGIRPPKSPRKLPHALTPDAAGQLMNVPGDDFTDVRDRAMLELFYSSGLRLSELAGLSIHDINSADRTVKVTGKGAKTRLVPVGKHALAAIEAWLPLRVKAAGINPALFVGISGRRLGVRSIENRVALRARQLGLPEKVHPHVLRHSFASHVLQSSGDLRAVQEMLGHSSIVSTQVYTHLDFQHLAKTYDDAHPRAKRKR